MPKYIVLFNFTDQGIRNIREISLRDKGRETRQRVGAMGVSGEFYLTQGPYDLVFMGEAPNDEVMTQAMLYVGSRGNRRTLTMRAFTEEEADRIIGGLPSS
ncbi:MAG: GYD domain-containing protein [Candidatus Binatia bacterium]